MQPHFSKGRKDSLAFVFSCPGSAEAVAGHPAAGNTGRNLEKLLVLLAHRMGEKALLRTDVTIANAWDKVEYGKLTRRSEATDAQIRLSSNLQRLAAELVHVTDRIVFFGDKAAIAARELSGGNLLPKQPSFAFAGHLSSRGLNKLKVDADGEPIVSAKLQRSQGRKETAKKIGSENTTRRLDFIAKSLVAQSKSLEAGD